MLSVYPYLPTKFFKTLLILTTGFVALSAIINGWGLIQTNGLGMSAQWLGGFSSFLVPGLILMLVVGGTSLFALVMTAKNWN